MSNIAIRPLRPKEYALVAELCNSEKLFPYLPDMFMHFWSPALVDAPKAVWAVELAGQLAGSAGYTMAEAAPGLWLIGIVVWPTYRRRGIGAFVYRSLVESLCRRGAQRLLTSVYTNQLDGLRFVAQRGFREIGSSLNYQLNVAADSSSWDDPDAIGASQGLRFDTLDHFPRQGLAARLLPLWNRTRPDQPHYWPYVHYDARRFEREMLEPAEVALPHSFVVVAPDNHIVALALNAYAASNRLCTIYLGVDPDFRRRKLATALKLKLIAHAQAHSVDFLAAENEASNTAMHHINRRLGYRHLPDLVVYQKTLRACQEISPALLGD
jgi:GNAT superfamily N-acetyltransferase